MRVAVRVLASSALAVLVCLGALYVALPPNETAEQGPADPVLALRRPVVALLGALGLMDPPGASRCLPSRTQALMGSAGADHDFVPGERVVRSREPVSRGLFWLVGDRITVRSTRLRTAPSSGHRQLRLCYAERGSRRVAGAGLFDPGAEEVEVRGYVPRSADEHWVEELDERGRIRSRHGWRD